MAKYRKRPEEIEAFQMTAKRRDDKSEWPDWLHKAWNKQHMEEGALYPEEKGSCFLCLMTGLGELRVRWNDYIVKLDEDDLRTMREGTFERLYEKAK